jgi:hypothetical protein
MVCNTDIIMSLSEGASNDGDYPPRTVRDEAPRLSAMVTRLRDQKLN